MEMNENTINENLDNQTEIDLLLKTENIKEEDNQTQKTNNIIDANEEQQFVPQNKKYCRECGHTISDKAFMCPQCGAAVNQSTIKEDVANTGLKVLSFFIPFAGLILYLMQYKEMPQSAKEYGKWALIGFSVGVIGYIIYYCVIVTAISGMFKGIYTAF